MVKDKSSAAFSRYRDLYRSLSSYFILHLPSTSLYRPFFLCITRVCAPPAAAQLASTNHRRSLHFNLLCEIFRSWPFPSGLYLYTSHPRPLLTCPLSSMAGANDIGESFYSPPRTLSPVLQLSSNGDGSFFDHTGMPRRPALPLCQPLFHHRSADLRLCEDIGGNFSLRRAYQGEVIV